MLPFAMFLFDGTLLRCRSQVVADTGFLESIRVGQHGETRRAGFRESVTDSRRHGSRPIVIRMEEGRLVAYSMPNFALP